MRFAFRADRKPSVNLQYELKLIMMKLTNNKGHTFELTILGYRQPFVQGYYFDNNWLSAYISMSYHKSIKKINLKFLQVEELIELMEWLEALLNDNTVSSKTFSFTDPYMIFRLGKGKRTDLIKFVFHSGHKRIYCWDMNRKSENIQDFKSQINELLIKFPLR
jgi:hypothetical protein